MDSGGLRDDGVDNVHLWVDVDRKHCTRTRITIPTIVCSTIS
jgi:hypothetical protein